MRKYISIVFFLFVSLSFLFVSCSQSDDKEYAPPASPGGTVNAPLSYNDEIDRLKDIVRKEPDNVHAWIKLGDLSMDTKRFADAIHAYENALKLDPNNVNVLVDMGTSYRYNGDPERAVEEYKKAIKIQPNHLYAHKNLGVVYAYDLNRHEEAVKEFETYLKLSPNAPDALQVSQLINEIKELKGK